MSLWFDTDAARTAADSWIAWGDRLEVDGRAIRLLLDTLALGGWPGGADLLDDAGDRLWQIAAFVDAVGSAVRHADLGTPTTAAVADLWWARARRIVAWSAPYRHAVAEGAAVERWSSGLDPGVARELFESRHGDDPAHTLAELTGPEAVVYWRSLPTIVQRDLIDARPDLVATRVLAQGAELDRDLLRRLDRANAYPEFTERFDVEVDVVVSARIVAFEIGGGFTAIATKLSDERVDLTLVEHVEVGLGIDLGGEQAASASASAGVFGELRQRFRFANEVEAAAAVATLEKAARHDASFGELVRDTGGVIWNGAVAPWNASAAVANWLVPFADPVPRAPTYDLTSETVERLRQLWATNGTIRQQGVGAFADVAGEFEIDLGAIEAELDASGEVRLMAYDTDVAAADTSGAVGQTGVMFSGHASIDLDGATGGTGPDLAGHAAAGAGFVVDLHHTDDDHTCLTLTLVTDVAAGTATELVDLAAFDLHTTVDATASMTMTYTVPVDDDTTDLVGAIGLELARGDLPTAALRELYDAAEIDVIITTGESTTTEFEADVAIVEAEVSVTAATETTRIALHKYPEGELFSRVEVDDLIDTARARR